MAGTPRAVRFAGDKVVFQGQSKAARRFETLPVGLRRETEASRALGAARAEPLVSATAHGIGGCCPLAM